MDVFVLSCNKSKYMQISNQNTIAKKMKKQNQNLNSSLSLKENIASKQQSVSKNEVQKNETNTILQHHESVERETLLKNQASTSFSRIEYSSDAGSMLGEVPYTSV